MKLLKPIQWLMSFIKGGSVKSAQEPSGPEALSSYFVLYRNCGGREFSYLITSREVAFEKYQTFKRFSHILELKEITEAGTVYHGIFVADEVDVNAHEYLFPKVK